MVEFERDPRVERALVLAAVLEGDAGRLVGAADKLSEFADERALPGPVRRRDGQSFPREAREELADARNYLVWHHQIREREGASLAELEKIRTALVALVGAWRAVSALETLDVLEAAADKAGHELSTLWVEWRRKYT